MTIPMLYISGNYHYKRNSAGVSGKLNVDNSLRYEVKMGADAEKSGPGMLYTPSLVVQGSGKTLLDLGGTIKYAPWKLFDVQMTLSGIVKPPVRAKGMLSAFTFFSCLPFNMFILISV